MANLSNKRLVLYLTQLECLKPLQTFPQKCEMNRQVPSRPNMRKTLTREHTPSSTHKCRPENFVCMF